MTMTTREPITLPLDLARKLVLFGTGRTVDGWTVVDIEEGDSGRWTRHMRLIVRRDSDGQLFASDYQVGLTEYQETEPWEYEGEAKFEPVERRPRMVEVVEYVPPEPPVS